MTVTLRRELNLMKTFCIEPRSEIHFNLDFMTFGENFTKALPSTVYEIDEAGKCHALGRSTACVFHLMRSLEIGVRATARCLGIPDPSRPAERNWGNILRSVKDEISRRTSGRAWRSGDAEFFN